jgi:hypothetical protein
VYRKRPELWPNDWVLHHDNFSAHKVLSGYWPLINEMEKTPTLSHDFWLFPKIKPALKGRRFQDTEDIQKKKVITALKAIHNRSSKNVSNSGSIIGISA